MIELFNSKIDDLDIWNNIVEELDNNPFKCILNGTISSNDKSYELKHLIFDSMSGAIDMCLDSDVLEFILYKDKNIYKLDTFKKSGVNHFNLKYYDS